MPELTPLITPPECFLDLPDYPFAERYLSVQHPRYGALRMHYVDEGPRTAPVVLMVHGEPSWSFSYRKVISAVSAAGYRVIAPDHIGFGKSDKLRAREDYSYQLFVDWLLALVQQLDLQDITIVGQDWGGPISLRTLVQEPARFRGIVVANTLLPNCEEPPRGIADWPGTIVSDWVDAVAGMDDMPVAAIVDGVTVNPLDSAVSAAYDAPFPEPAFKAAALVFPGLIPIAEAMAGTAENRAAWQVLEQLQLPAVTAFSDSDPSTKPWEAVFQSRLPGLVPELCREIKSAGHFVQEDQPQQLAEVVLALQSFIDRSGEGEVNV